MKSTRYLSAFVLCFLAGSLFGCDNSSYSSISSSFTKSSSNVSLSTSSNDTSIDSSSIDISSKTIVQYKVTFVNYDNSLLYECFVKEGEDAIYPYENPSKPSDSEFNYEFSKWSENVVNVKKEITTKAEYKAIPKTDWGEISWF